MMHQDKHIAAPEDAPSASDFRAPFWLPGRHIQTIYSAEFVRRAAVQYRRERWDAPDGDFIDVDFVDGEPGQPMLVLFHGLEGSSDSPYARAIMAHIASLGWSGAVPHFRSCSGELNLGPRLYHCADHAEADWVLRQLNAGAKARANAAGVAMPPLFTAGASLGGSVLLQWLGQNQNCAGIVDAACAICAPLDVTAGGHGLSRGLSAIYGQSFLRRLKPKALRKLEQHPGLYSADRVRACRTIYEFDDVVTAPLHGFRGTEHYWQAASANAILSDIRVPTLLINTRNDPCVPASSLPDTVPPGIKLELLQNGGHLGFISGPPPGRQEWLPERLVSWFLHGS